MLTPKISQSLPHAHTHTRASQTEKKKKMVEASWAGKVNGLEMEVDKSTRLMGAVTFLFEQQVQDEQPL